MEMKEEKAKLEQNEIPKPFSNNTSLLKLDTSTMNILVKKLHLLEDQKTKELILLDSYIKSLNSTETQIKRLKSDESSFSNKNLTKNVTSECNILN